MENMENIKIVDFIKNHLKETGQAELKISDIAEGINLPVIDEKFLEEIEKILEKDNIFSSIPQLQSFSDTTSIKFYRKQEGNNSMKEALEKETLTVPDDLLMNLYDFGTKENYEKFQAYMDTCGIIALFLVPAKKDFLSDLINRILIKEVEHANKYRGERDPVMINYMNFETGEFIGFEELNIFNKVPFARLIMAEKMSEIAEPETINSIFEKAKAISLGSQGRRMIFVFHCPSLELMKAKGRYGNFERVTSDLSKYFDACFILQGRYKTENIIPEAVREKILDHLRLLSETPFLKVKQTTTLFKAYEDMQRVHKNAQSRLYLSASPMEMALLNPSGSYDLNYMILFTIRTLTGKPYNHKITDIITNFSCELQDEKNKSLDLFVKNKIGVLAEQLNNIPFNETQLFGLNSVFARYLNETPDFFSELEEIWQVLPGFEYARNYNFQKKREQIYHHFVKLRNSNCKIRFFVPDYENCRLVQVDMRETCGFENELSESGVEFLEEKPIAGKEKNPEKKNESGPDEPKGFAKVAGYREEIAFFEKIIKLQKRKIRAGINGIMMFGLPGCGKTYLARAFAEESERTFYYISPTDIVSKYIGESQQNLRNLFSEAKRHSPSVIFIDEIDSFGFSRRDVQAHTDQKSTINQLLIEINDLPKDSEVLVMAATNYISRLDAALIRSGRFDIKMAVSPPSEDERRELFSFYLNQLKREFNSLDLKCFEPDSEDLNKLASASFHFTPSDIDTVVKKFRLHLLTEEVTQAGVGDVLEIVESIRNSGFLTLTENEVKQFLEECRKFGLKLEKTDILAKEWSIARPAVGFKIN